jgi:ribosome biogenesis protein ENP2
VKELLEKDAKKSVTGGAAVDKLMQDDRFKMMFQDKAFEIDKNTDAYKLTKSGNVNKKVRQEDVDSAPEDEEPAVKARDLNKLFAGKGDEDNDEQSGEDDEDDDDFQAKMSKK